MVGLIEIVGYLDDLLDVSAIEDYCPNGLQVQGSPTVSRIVTGVTACQALLDEAAAQNADAILVHHGYFWQSDATTLVGTAYQRIKTLVQHDMALLAYHLPLDVHPELGNNAQLAQLLGITEQTRLDAGGVANLLSLGALPAPMPAQDFALQVEQVLGRKPLHIASGPDVISSVAWCTGAAQDFIAQAAQHSADVYITGEVSERTVHMARELGLHFIAAGHHATERCGIQALGEHVQQQFGVPVTFIDIDNPV